MFRLMTPIDRCSEVAGLRPHEIVVGVTPSEKHERLLKRYRSRRSRAAARVKLVADIRRAVSAGAARSAADLLIVLRRLLALGPCAPAGGRAPGTRRRRGASRERSVWRAGLSKTRVPTASGAKVIPFPSRPANGAADPVV